MRGEAGLTVFFNNKGSHSTARDELSPECSLPAELPVRSVVESEEYRTESLARLPIRDAS
jgi:hypothetical protein